MTRALPPSVWRAQRSFHRWWKELKRVAFPPSGWTLSNPDQAITWARTTLAKKTGSASMFMDNYDYSASGALDDFVTPPLHFSNATSAQMTFELAYQLYTNPTANPNFSDTLRVDVSADRGVTCQNVYFKHGSTGPNMLTTVTPAFSTTEFVPNSS